jgi:hypothetical protein
MPNIDRPNGLRPVKTISGAPVTALIRAVGVADGADLFVGDSLNLESGLAAPGATNDAAFLGVAVGFGKFDKDGRTPLGMFNPANLNSDGTWYDDSASTHTEWCVYYVPANDVVFEAQTATALTLVVGSTCDLLPGTGSATTGQSASELTTNSNADFTVVEVPNIVGNAPTEVWGRYWVMFTHAEQAFQ